ncbi:MAG: aromatic ring-hydroxylating dioxygenase subunit alpha, partial [Verrucomicrobiota bacterium]
EPLIRSACHHEGHTRPFSSSHFEEEDLSAVQKEVQHCADLPLGEAMTLPASAYTSPDVFSWEINHIFRAEWLCVAHQSQIPKAGDYLNFDLFGDPLIIVRGKDESIRILSRVCPHRGMDIMPEGFDPGTSRDDATEPNEPTPCSHTRLFLCPYHSWTFDLDGRLKACPEMGQAEGFCRDDFPLTEFRSEVWQGFVFVNLDGKAPKSVHEQYAEFGRDIAPWNMEAMEVIVESEWDCPFNWKVMIENFMESYHHAGAHSKTLQVTMPAKETWTEEEKAHYIRCHLPFRPSARREVDEKEAGGDRGYIFPPIEGISDEARYEWGLYLGFPCFMYVVAADCAVWYRLQPISAHRCRLTTTVMAPRDLKNHPDFEEMKNEATKMAIDFHLEDMHVCLAVQRGFSSGSYRQGRLSHLEMPVWLIQRYLAARQRDTWPTMDRPPAPSQEHSKLREPVSH